MELHLHLYNSLDLLDEQRVDIIVEVGGLEPAYNVNIKISSVKCVLNVKFFFYLFIYSYTKVYFEHIYSYNSLNIYKRLRSA